MQHAISEDANFSDAELDLESRSSGQHNMLSHTPAELYFRASGLIADSNSRLRSHEILLIEDLVVRQPTLLVAFL